MAANNYYSQFETDDSPLPDIFGEDESEYYPANEVLDDDVDALDNMSDTKGKKSKADEPAGDEDTTADDTTDDEGGDEGGGGADREPPADPTARRRRRRADEGQSLSSPGSR